MDFECEALRTVVTQLAVFSANLSELVQSLQICGNLMHAVLALDEGTCVLKFLQYPPCKFLKTILLLSLQI